jgi:hypothetical protein
MAHAGGGLADAQRLRRLSVGKLLEVPKQDDLAIVVVQPEKCSLKPELELAPQCVSSRREIRVSQLSRQIERRTISKSATTLDGARRLFAVYTPLGPPAVPAVRIDHAILCDLAQPEMKRHYRVTQILPQSLARTEQHVLHHVTRIDATRHSLVEPKADHPPQRWAVAFPELVRCRAIRGSHTLEQIPSLAGVRPDQSL